MYLLSDAFGLHERNSSSHPLIRYQLYDALFNAPVFCLDCFTQSSRIFIFNLEALFSFYVSDSDTGIK